MKTLLLVTLLLISTLSFGQTKTDLKDKLVKYKLELVRSTTQEEKDILIPYIKEIEIEIKNIEKKEEVKKQIAQYRVKSEKETIKKLIELETQTKKIREKSDSIRVVVEKENKERTEKYNEVIKQYKKELDEYGIISIQTMKKLREL